MRAQVSYCGAIRRVVFPSPRDREISVKRVDCVRDVVCARLRSATRRPKTGSSRMEIVKRIHLTFRWQTKQTINQPSIHIYSYSNAIFAKLFDNIDDIDDDSDNKLF